MTTPEWIWSRTTLERTHTHLISGISEGRKEGTSPPPHGDYQAHVVLVGGCLLLLFAEKRCFVIQIRCRLFATSSLINLFQSLVVFPRSLLLGGWPPTEPPPPSLTVNIQCGPVVSATCSTNTDRPTTHRGPWLLFFLPTLCLGGTITSS